jgi:hypothetical protein
MNILFLNWNISNQIFKLFPFIVHCTKSVLKQEVSEIEQIIIFKDGWMDNLQLEYLKGHCK